VTYQNGSDWVFAATIGMIFGCVSLVSTRTSRTKRADLVAGRLPLGKDENPFAGKDPAVGPSAAAIDLAEPAAADAVDVLEFIRAGHGGFSNGSGGNHEVTKNTKAKSLRDDAALA
jgi:hypothetical protein